MTHPEHSPKQPSRATGRFATLRAFLHTKGGGAPSIRRLATGLICVAAVLALTTAPASAKQARLFAGTFGGPTNTGEFASTPVNPYPVAESTGLAVDEASHDVYDVDFFNHRVEKFSSSGEFLLTFGKEVNETEHDRVGLEPGETIQEKEAKENVCTAASLDICKEGVSFSGPAGFEFPGYIAVDNSPGGEGDVYVADGSSVKKFDSGGQPIAGWSATAGGGSLGLGSIAGLATDPAGNLWVLVTHRSQGSEATISEFHSNGSSITALEGLPSIQGSGIAVDVEDDLYLGHLAEKYSSAGVEIGPVLGEDKSPENSFGFSADSIVVDQLSGEVYVGVESEKHDYFINRYDSSCHPFPNTSGEGCRPAESFGASHFSNAVRELAIDPSTPADTVYASQVKNGQVTVFSRETVPDVLTTKPVNPTLTSATLAGTVNPSGIELNSGLEGCRFEYVETAKYEPSAANPYAAGQTVPCDKSAAQIGTGTEPVEVQASITGLRAGETYHYRLVASNHNDVSELNDEPSFGQDLAFGPPRIESGSALGATSTSAKLEAAVNPNDLDTHVRIEYGTEAGVYDQRTAETDLGFAGTGQSAAFQLLGLSPNTTYRYRVVAENVLGEVTGADLSFTTQRGGAMANEFTLPDDRAWELVSPPDKHGALIEPISETGVIQAAASGDAITYLATAPTESQPQGNANEAQILSVRGGEGTSSWQSQDIAPPHEDTPGNAGAFGNEYRFFSADLSQAVLQPFGPFTPSISAEASEQTPFLRNDFPAADPTSFCGSSCYRPLLTAADVSPEGTAFGEDPRCVPHGETTASSHCGAVFLGASPDAAHVVLRSAVPLSEGAPAGNPQSETGSLYEWGASAAPAERLELVSVRPGADGDAPASSTPALGSDGNARNAVSLDGSRVVWSEKAGNHHLYLRDTEVGHEQTLQLDLKQGGSGAGAANPVYHTASTDDSRIFFTDEQRLTANSGAANEEPDLYECLIVTSEEGELGCKLTDLTPEPKLGESAAVLGSVIGASEDGSSVYFVANGVLASNMVTNGAGPEEAKPGACPFPPLGKGTPPSGASCNLYLSREGHTVFIASLSAADSPDWNRRFAFGLSEMPARMSPDGRWLAFMSDRSLTGYDNRDIASGKPDEEVYLYHSTAGEGESTSRPSTLVCASCEPSGARPRGIQFANEDDPIAGRNRFFGEALVAANVPGWTRVGVGVGSLHQPRYLSNGGRLFFDSLDPLVPQDSNGTEDVYEYEPTAGEGAPPADTCTTESSAYSLASAGCIDLISSGTSKEESVFLDASEFGEDVFFLTSAQLSKRDADTTPDVYDARVGGGEGEPVKPVECQGDACQSPVAAPEDATPGSLTFKGPGNLVTPLVSPAKKKSTKKALKCKKGQVKKKVKKKEECVKKPKKSAHKSAKGRK